MFSQQGLTPIVGLNLTCGESITSQCILDRQMMSVAIQGLRPDRCLLNSLVTLVHTAFSAKDHGHTSLNQRSHTSFFVCRCVTFHEKKHCVANLEMKVL